MSRAYESYRDSGVEWVGRMPAHWQVKPLLAVAAECDRPNRGMIEENLLSLSYGRIVRKDINENDGLLPESFETYQIVEPNDIVWRLTDLQNDKRSLRTALVKERGIITSAYLSTVPTDINPLYLSYLLRAYDVQKVFYSMGGGIRQGMNFSDVKRLPILTPPVNEQIAISAFLDRETSKIDALAEAQRVLIKLLDEERQAITSQGVTKGLDPSVPMKDTGIEWLGEVPAHWTVGPLKRFWSVTDCKHVTPEFVDDGIPLASIREVQSRYVDLSSAKRTTETYFKILTEGGRLPLPGDLIFSRNATVGEVTEVPATDLPFAMGQDVCLLRKRRPDASTAFLYAVLKSAVIAKQLARIMVGATFKRINVDDIKNLIITFPPADEQAKIADYLEKLETKRAVLTAQAERTASLLHERRTGLISAAVTGKIDVRSASASSTVDLCRNRFRLAVGAVIIEALAHKPSSGRTKTHKIVYLTETHARAHELEGVYLREAAGPLDVRLIHEMEAALQKVGHISVEQPGGHGSQVTYKVRGTRGAFRNELEQALGPRAKILDKLISDLGELDTKSVEAVATLYAVWNDALLDGSCPSDNEIVAGVLDDWHPEKRQKFKAQQLHIWLGWMRRHALVPEGRGPKTTRGRLFA